MTSAGTSRIGRVGLRWVTAISVALSLAVAAAPAQAAGPVTSHLRAAAAPSTVLINTHLVVSGAISPGIKGKPVYLQRLVARHWKTVGHVASGKHGVYRFSVKATGKPSVWVLRVIRPASSLAKAVVGKTLRVRLTKTKYTVSAVAVTQVNAGDAVVVTGAVSPKSSGKVYLQVLHLGAWKTLSSTTMSGSSYTFSVKLPPKTYPLRVLKPLNAKIAQGESRSINVTVLPPVGTVIRPTLSAHLSVTSPDDGLTGLSGNRLIFSTAKAAVTPARTFTFTNTGNAAATVSGLSIQGTNASSFTLAPGQPTTFVVPAGGSATVGVLFTPTATTNCPFGTTYPNDGLIGDSTRQASLVYTTTDPGLPGGNAILSGLNACDYSSTQEPVLDQVLSTLGYTDVVVGPKTNRRSLGMSGPIPGTDEVSAPYFRAADPALPVSMVPLAHYSTTATVPYQSTGWYAQGDTVGPDGTCNASCHQVWAFPGEPGAPTSFEQNQKLLPVPTGLSTFSPTGAFGLYNGEFSNVNFSDDMLNIAHQCVTDPNNAARTCYKDNQDVSPIEYLHNVRIYPAYGRGHVVIPNSYLVAIDVSRLADKNYDFQDVVLLVRNVVPAG